VVVTGSPEVLVVAGLHQQRKNNSPQPDCSGGDDRISEECIPLENEIQEAMAMLENEKNQRKFEQDRFQKNVLIVSSLSYTYSQR
jgi:hypothetical protein